MLNRSFSIKLQNLNFLLKKILLLVVIVSCLIYLLLYKSYSLINISISSNLINYNKIIQINIEQVQKETESNEGCPLPILNEWDQKIKKMFQTLPVYMNCTKSEPFTYVINRTIFFNSNVNETFYKGLN